MFVNVSKMFYLLIEMTQVNVAFPVSINNIGHLFNSTYVAEFMYDATGAYGLC